MTIEHQRILKRLTLAQRRLLRDTSLHGITLYGPYISPATKLHNLGLAKWNNVKLRLTELGKAVRHTLIADGIVDFRTREGKARR